MTNFNGRPVLVTGASGAIGGATVRLLVERGAEVIVSSRHSDNLQALAAKFGVQSLPFDLTSETEVEAALSGLEVWGVVNCGGVGGEVATPNEGDGAGVGPAVSIKNPAGLPLTE